MVRREEGGEGGHGQRKEGRRERRGKIGEKGKARRGDTRGQKGSAVCFVNQGITYLLVSYVLLRWKVRTGRTRKEHDGWCSIKATACIFELLSLLCPS